MRLPAIAPVCCCAAVRKVGIELERAGLQVEGYQSRPFGCEVGSQFHRGHVSRGPPIMPDGQISRVRFEALAFLPWTFPAWRGLSAGSQSAPTFAVCPWPRPIVASALRQL